MSGRRVRLLNSLSGEAEIRGAGASVMPPPMPRPDAIRQPKRVLLRGRRPQIVVACARHRIVEQRRAGPRVDLAHRDQRLRQGVAVASAAPIATHLLADLDRKTLVERT